MAKKMKFNPSEYENELERKQVGEQLIMESNLLSSFFKKLSNSRDVSPATEAIRSIADLLKISSDMIELELSSMVSRYGDLTADHIKALINMRGDISSAETKTVIESSMQQRKTKKVVTDIKIFSEIPVTSSFFSR
jgi:exocyst complex component 3